MMDEIMIWLNTFILTLESKSWCVIFTFWCIFIISTSSHFSWLWNSDLILPLSNTSSLTIYVLWLICMVIVASFIIKSITKMRRYRFFSSINVWIFIILLRRLFFKWRISKIVTMTSRSNIIVSIISLTSIYSVLTMKNCLLSLISHH